ncbi:phage antirepressor [Selenomonas sp. WCA-380-WT-3B 3/]|uniref:Phage antirepressor n=1 Tax=Selenomonas montiformis TaxID=2652285 RepID=A0A6I2UTM8_9FIRM|nr:phage antirepressor KilAC domain-containing protein [Selenomonas montiformis]MSV23725.1 phage antirepressor [Selenomonas montiformis]
MIQVFENKEFGKVRTMAVNGEPFFVGKDVAEILGYADTNKAIAMHVDEEDKLNDKTALSLGQRGGWFINESGLYSLILTSKLPKAKAFKRWVTSEVLPSIRKHGLYAVDEILANPDIAIKALQELKSEREKRRSLEGTVAVQNQQIAEMQPKVSYYDLILQCPDLMPITTIAKDYGWSAKRLNAYLHEQGIQFKQSGIWLLYQQYAEQGYTSTKTHNYAGEDGTQHAKPHTYWTQKGRLFLYDFLKARGILPLIEREG